MPSLTVVIPGTSFTGRPFKSHLNSMGKSPDVTKHATLAESAKLDGSFPKSKGAIFGGTIGTDLRENKLCNVVYSIGRVYRRHNSHK